jgi:tight adherence protein B
MDNQTLTSFLILIFGAVLLLAHSLLIPTFGTGRVESKRLRQRLGTLADEMAGEKVISLLREKYLKSLSPWEKWLEALPGMRALEAFIERAGHGFPAYRLVLLSLSLGSVGGVLAWGMTRNPWIVPVAALGLAWLPVMKLKMDLTRRFNLFEEQLPEALDVITRALRAGYPFNETLRVVSTEMEAPIAKEFGVAFDEINYGLDMRWALKSLVNRMPSVSLMAVVTTVLVQRETGGNLAETLQTISGVIRARFKFQRNVRTLTAEARMSAWVLILVPFFLFAVLFATNPEYIRILIMEPVGKKLLLTGFVLLTMGSLWIRRMINLEI